MQIKDRIKELRRVKASELLPNPKNWRTHPDNQKNALKAVLAEIGYADAVLAYETSNGLMLVDGHLRAETTPDNMVPVLILDINETEADKLLATIDPLAGLAQQDSEKLANLFQNLKDMGDSLVNQIWPDYIIDPLLTADWSPNDVVPSESKNIEDKITITITEAQKETIDEALKLCRKQNETNLTDGQGLEIICNKFLNDFSK